MSAFIRVKELDDNTDQTHEMVMPPYIVGLTGFLWKAHRTILRPLPFPAVR